MTNVDSSQTAGEGHHGAGYSRKAGEHIRSGYSGERQMHGGTWPTPIRLVFSQSSDQCLAEFTAIRHGQDTADDRGLKTPADDRRAIRHQPDALEAQPELAGGVFVLVRSGEDEHVLQIPVEAALTSGIALGAELIDGTSPVHEHQRLFIALHDEATYPIRQRIDSRVSRLSRIGVDVLKILQGVVGILEQLERHALGLILEVHHLALDVLDDGLLHICVGFDQRLEPLERLLFSLAVLLFLCLAGELHLKPFHVVILLGRRTYCRMLVSTQVTEMNRDVLQDQRLGQLDIDLIGLVKLLP